MSFYCCLFESLLHLLKIQGLQWFMLAEDEIVPSIIAMDGRRSRHTQSEHQMTGDDTVVRHPHPKRSGENNFRSVSDAKMLRKLEAQGQLAS